MVQHDSGKVNNPGRDRRVSDSDRFLDDRRREAMAMIALWLRSTKPHARDELAYWRGVLKEIDLQAARLRLREFSGDEPANESTDSGADDCGYDQ